MVLFWPSLILGFWQYGLIDWKLFYHCLETIIVSSDAYAIFPFEEDVAGKSSGPLIPASPIQVDPGMYTLLRPGNYSFLVVHLVFIILTSLDVACRRRSHFCRLSTPFRSSPAPITLQYSCRRMWATHSVTHGDFWQKEHYRTRVCSRDPFCLISGLKVTRDNFSRFKATHIFPRGYELEVRPSTPLFVQLTLNFQWNRNGYLNRITDPASLAALGGPSKIDSLQNVILLRSDLHDAWDNYQFSVNPDVCLIFVFLLLTH